MVERDWLAERLEQNRTHLRAVAFRMLGSRSEADDAVQEAWIRLGRADTSGVENLGGWLTTVVARVCLDPRRVRVEGVDQTVRGRWDEGTDAAANPAGSPPRPPHRTITDGHPPGEWSPPASRTGRAPRRRDRP